jgi:hypothetical protein
VRAATSFFSLCSKTFIFSPIQLKFLSERFIARRIKTQQTCFEMGSFFVATDRHAADPLFSRSFCRGGIAVKYSHFGAESQIEKDSSRKSVV